MNCALAILLPNFYEGTMHRAPTLLFYVLFGFQIIIIYSTKGLKNPSFLEEKVITRLPQTIFNIN